MTTRLRPPGAGAEAELLAACIKCGRCVEACPYGSIQLAGWSALRAYGTPFVDPLRSPCYLCMKCPQACPTDALQLLGKRQTRMGTARLDTSTCLSHNFTLCNVCYKRCPLQGEAIDLDDELRPAINESACVGCGVCAHVCPSEPRSIHIEPAGPA